MTANFTTSLVAVRLLTRKSQNSFCFFRRDEESRRDTARLAFEKINKMRWFEHRTLTLIPSQYCVTTKVSRPSGEISDIPGAAKRLSRFLVF
jgi:hypothetical protein